MQLTEREKSETEENCQQSYSSFSLVIDTIYVYSQTCVCGLKSKLLCLLMESFGDQYFLTTQQERNLS